MKPTTSFKWLILTILALHARPLPSLDLRCGVLIAIHSRAALKVQALERAQTRFVSLNSGSSWEDFLQENPFHDILGRATVYVANSRENQNKIFAGEAEIFAEVVQRVEAEVDELAKARGAFSGRLPNYGNIPIGEKTFETLGYSDVYLAAESFLRQNLFRLCQANSAEPDRVINSPRFFENFHDAVIDDIWNTLRVNPGRFFPPKPFGTSIESHFESAIITVLKRPKTEKPESVSAPILEDEPLPNQRVLRKFIEHHFTIPRSGLDIEPEGWRKLILNLQKPIARVAGSLRLERKPFVKLTRRGLRAVS